jgi:hypothetical protein
MSTKYEQVQTGIYRYVIPAQIKNGKKIKTVVTYHERPTVAGGRTFRSLGFNFTRQTSLINAETEYSRRRTEVAAGRDPYADKQAAAVVATVGDAICAYADAGYPDKHLHPRTGRTLDCERRNCETLQTYWDTQLWTFLSQKALSRNHAVEV